MLKQLAFFCFSGRTISYRVLSYFEIWASQTSSSHMGETSGTTIAFFVLIFVLFEEESSLLFLEAKSTFGLLIGDMALV